MLRMLQKKIFCTQFSAHMCKSDKHVEFSQIRCYSRPGNNIDLWFASLDEAQQKRVRFLQNELALEAIESKQVPKLENMTVDDFKHALSLSQNQRKSYYKYLFKTHNCESAESRKQYIRKLLSENKKSEDTADDAQVIPKYLQYGLGKNSLIPKIYGRTIDKWRNMRGLWRLTLGDPKIIFDCSYSAQMNHRENKETAKQLSFCFGKNRTHREPFELHFCGLNQRTNLWNDLQSRIPTLTKKPLPIQIHFEDICDVFPKEKLVILTPDSPNILDVYNPDDHYVINGLVDRGDKLPLSMAKAKKFDIRTARLPLEQFRRCQVNKTITLDQMLEVMLEMKLSHDWNKALSFIARRKFR